MSYPSGVSHLGDYLRRRLHESREMAIDPYQQCPCGLEKKLKFCCGSEIFADLEKIESALGNDQRLAALDHANHALEAKADRPCMLMYKALAQIGLEEAAAAKETADKLLTVSPDNPAGLAISAMLGAETDLPLAIARLQRAMELQKGKLLPTVYEALGAVGMAAWLQGFPLAGRHFLLFQVMASQSKDQIALRALLELDASGQVPLAAQGFINLEPLPAESALPAAAIAEFNQALQDWRLGCFHAAAKRLEKLAPTAPNEPLVWRNLGVLMAALAENPLALATLRKYASFAAIPRDEAVEAEAVAVGLVEVSDEEMLSEVVLKLAVTDAAALRERWTGDKQLPAVPFDPQEYVDAGRTPPLAIYSLLDRPSGEWREGLAWTDVACVLGEIELYGKQTDQDARAEFTALQDDAYAAKAAAFRAAVGEQCGRELGSESAPLLPACQAIFRANWRLPKGTSPAAAQDLANARFRHQLVKVFPDVVHPALDGLTLRQAAANPALQNRVLAVILNSETSGPEGDEAFNLLRRELGLPTADELDPSGLRVAELPPVRLLRIDLAKLADQELLDLYFRSQLIGHRLLLKRATEELVKRPQLDKEHNKPEALMTLARLATSEDAALAHVQAAQQAAVAAKGSPAKYLLAEIPLAMQRRDGERVGQIIQTLQTKHVQEPGVAQALYSLLMQMGVIRPGGPLAGGAPLGGAAAVGPTATPVATSTLPPGGVWSPDAPAPAAEQPKSKLWLPGMD